MIQTETVLADDPQTWTAVGFLHHFKRIHETMEDRTFAFILGAGASVTSGIPAGGTLAKRWLEELYLLRVGSSTKVSLEEWATPENVGIPGLRFDRLASFYPEIYSRCFADDPEAGYAYLEKAMSSAEPNIGYSVLSQILEKTRHKVAITTNFDNLITDALSIYSSTHPIVCDYDSLAGLVLPKLRRPLVAKVYRDALLSRHLDSSAMQFGQRWARMLKRLLVEHTPIVIGYEGNDGFLMELLEAMEPGEIRGRIYWCYKRSAGLPGERIRRLVANHSGKLVEIAGFDEFMLQMGEQFGYKLLDVQIERHAQKRVKRYREQIEQFQRSISQVMLEAEAEDSIRPVRDALNVTAKRDRSWWAWELRAQAELDPDRREQTYRQGLEQFPGSGRLTAKFARFMQSFRKDFDDAERLYRSAIELEPEEPEIATAFASFMADVRRDYDEAERLHRFAMSMDPSNVQTIGSFAAFMWKVRKNYDEAERLYRNALDLDPESTENTVNFAGFMCDVRKNYDEAEQLCRRALDLDPNDAIKLANFAGFIWKVHKNYDEAERLFQYSLDLNPDDIANTLSFAGFLLVRKRFKDARERLARAWTLNRGGVSALAAEIAFYWSLIARMEKRDDSPGLARLKYLLAQGIEKKDWALDSALYSADDELSGPDMNFYATLADAILNIEEAENLERFENWKSIKPIPPDRPWKMRG
ncbi:MAG: tetratricopeptide repeat protein [Acidobacteriota bacterium]